MIKLPDLLLDKDSKTLKRDITDILNKVFPSQEVIKISDLKGGVTNIMYVVSLKEKKSKLVEKFIIRINGDNSELVVERAKELEVLTKVFPNLAIKCIFKNGLIYGFLEGRSLKPEETRMEQHCRGIAKSLANLHVRSDVDIGNKDLYIFKKINYYFRKIEKIEWTKKEQEELLKSLQIPVLKSMVERIEKYTTTHWDERTVKVICHNDLHGGNVIFNEKDNSYGFIDYEYAGYSYRGFDFGNFFAEFMGFDCDETKRAKEEEIQYFLESYSEALRTKQMKVNDNLENKKNEEKEEKERIARLRIETSIGLLLSHCVWGLWGFFMSTISSIDFDYFTYGQKRVSLFYKDFEKISKELNL